MGYLYIGIWQCDHHDCCSRHCCPCRTPSGVLYSFFSIRALSIPACSRSRPASGIIIFSYSSLIVSTVPVLSYLFSICPVGSDRSCYLFLYLPISLCLYLSYVLPIYDVGAKSHDFDYGLLSPCCPRGSAAVFHHPVQPALYRTQVLIQDLRDLLQLPVLKNRRTTMARSFGSRFSIARFKSIFS